MNRILLPCGNYSANERELIKEMWQPEFLDVMYPFILGIKKHGTVNFLDVAGKTCSRKNMFASKTRHAAAVYMGQTHDDESGKHHSLHEGARCLIEHVRYERGLFHPEDRL